MNLGKLMIKTLALRPIAASTVEWNDFASAVRIRLFICLQLTGGRTRQSRIQRKSRARSNHSVTMGEKTGSWEPRIEAKRGPLILCDKPMNLRFTDDRWPNSGS
jgi:hypothetical protein